MLTLPQRLVFDPQLLVVDFELMELLFEFSEPLLERVILIFMGIISIVEPFIVSLFDNKIATQK